jgi:enoyl-CoA hydratase/carnithine racemase
MTAAKKIASQSPLAAMLNKELVNAAFETTLDAGVKLERRLFHSLFSFADQKEGMGRLRGEAETRSSGASEVLTRRGFGARLGGRC